ncbi:putative disease resistance RPP13-like protein 3 [Camellia sinensis]|uniref:putative disease resistance RPP13-like protein 3 n=1 Tax=Camellia sinensis TaxID=4442 RepID=UPI0010369C0C|nr:putative disease resistance RPP13-like protein 3 [Camellia sinensis]
MVDVVVSSIVRRLGGLLIDQVIFLQGVRDEVNYLRTKLEYMLCFLKDAEEKQYRDSRIRKWVSDIRDVAYEAEDIIDKFVLKVKGGIPKRTGFKACLRKYFCIYKQANKYGIGKEIQEWKNRLDEIDRNHEFFKIRNIEATGEGSSSMNERFKKLLRTTPYEDDQHVLGFTKDVKLLTSKLLQETPHQCVILIVGMGGLGKTTLARKLYNSSSVGDKLYNSSSVGDKFKRKGWVSVSKDYNIQNLLRRTTKSFKMPTTKDELEMLEKMEKEDLECHLHELLKESRYLEVIAISTSILSNESSRIPFLNGDNFSDWKDKILLTLWCMDLDLVLRVDEPPEPTDESSAAEKSAYDKWERSNRLSLMLIKSQISQSIRGSIPPSDKVKNYMRAIEEQFVSSDKALASTLMNKLSGMKHNNSRNVREHIMEMRDIAARLKSLEIEISESFLVNFILNSLPVEYGAFQISYNTQKEKWSINELLTMRF